MALRRKPEDEMRLLEVDASMSGSLSFKDPVNLQINGRFDGTLDIKGSLTIGPSAQVKATIYGEEMSVAGSVEGTVVASKRLELLSTARVTGKVTAPKLVVHEGAVLHGSCDMVSASPAPAEGGAWMSVEDLARYLEVEAGTIVEWAATGRLPGRQDGAAWQFDRKRIEEWLAQEKIK